MEGLPVGSLQLTTSISENGREGHLQTFTYSYQTQHCVGDTSYCIKQRKSIYFLHSCNSVHRCCYLRLNAFPDVKRRHWASNRLTLDVGLSEPLGYRAPPQNVKSANKQTNK